MNRRKEKLKKNKEHHVHLHSFRRLKKDTLNALFFLLKNPIFIL